MPARSLTVNERVLVHLKEAWVGQPLPTAGCTQEGIAKALGIRANHVSRAMKALLREELIEEVEVRVRGEVRRRKAYALTIVGRTTAAELYQSSAAHEVLVRSDSGESRMSLDAAQRLPGGPHTLTRLLGAVRGGRLDTRKLKVIGPEGSRILVELGMPPPRPLLGRSAEIRQLETWLGSAFPALVVLGDRGIGKSSLIAHAARSWSDSHDVFWHAFRPGETEPSVSEALAAFLRAVPGGRALPQSTVGALWPRLRGRDAVLVFDGLQDIDADTRRSVLEIAGAAAEVGAHTLLLSDTPWRGLAELRAKGFLQEVRVRGLSREDSRLLVGVGMSDVEFGRLHRLSQGNPLALQLAAAAWKDGQSGDLSDTEKSLMGYLRSVRGRR